MYEGTPAPASRARLDTNLDIADAVCHCPPARPHTLPSYFSFDTGASAPPAHPPAGYLHGLTGITIVFFYGHADAADNLAQWLGVDAQVRAPQPKLCSWISAHAGTLSSRSAHRGSREFIEDAADTTFECVLRAARGRFGMDGLSQWGKGIDKVRRGGMDWVGLARSGMGRSVGLV
ncbi:hypothetical protein B0H11DRAFT_2061002 [Mycena galericulata]|nr:hypothetical protein B0H11DRAFT_2061002 [Mycena galericulata]